MSELEHQRDRRKFKQNFRLAFQTERLMEQQRRNLGLPSQFKGSERFKIIPFRPHQPRD